MDGYGRIHSINDCLQSILFLHFFLSRNSLEGPSLLGVQDIESGQPHRSSGGC
jgi:hypothetical protein